jgi:hypothetical protein
MKRAIPLLLLAGALLGITPSPQPPVRVSVEQPLQDRFDGGEHHLTLDAGFGTGTGFAAQSISTDGGLSIATLADGGVLLWATCDGGGITTEALTVSAPLSLYDDGGVTNLSLTLVTGALSDGGTFVSGVLSDGGSYVANYHLSAFFPGISLAAGTVLIQSRFTAPAIFTWLSTTIVTSGSDAAHTFTMDVYDATTSSVVCVSQTIPCNGSPGGAYGGVCNGRIALYDDVSIRINDSACSVTAPILNVAAEYR